MKWSIVKTGAEKFDALHAYGLAILISHASRDKVQIEDCGGLYEVESSASDFVDSSQGVLTEVLALPSEELLIHIEDFTQLPFVARNFDGLLAAHFTVKGMRAVSITDLLRKQNLDKTCVGEAITKIEGAINRLNHFVGRTAARSNEWIRELCDEYEAVHPKIPAPVRAANPKVSLLMTVDPVYSISTRQALSDGHIESRYNLAMQGTTYAATLALIGASRFLRAQRVSNDRVNFYVPLAQRIVLSPELSLGVMKASDKPVKQALLFHWLEFWQFGPRANWRGLSYQVLQTQGVMQSISVDRGNVEYGWLRELQRISGKGLISYWFNLFRYANDGVPFEIDHLLDFLLSRTESAWLSHLEHVATYLQANSWSIKTIYSLQQLREVNKMAGSDSRSPLRQVLEREAGTLRFGQALRLLGKYNPASLKDVSYELYAATTCDDLLAGLTHAVQECALAASKTRFIVVPNEDDLKYLLDDVKEHSVRTISRLLIILSTVRYPRNADALTSESITAEQNESEHYE